jgi:mercuric ion transport protein
MENQTLKGCGQAVCNCSKKAAVQSGALPIAVKDKKPRTIIASIGSVLMPVLFAFFPKCAFCWAAYFAALNSLGFASIPYMPWLRNVFLVFMLLSLVVLYRAAQRRGRWLPFGMQLAGISVMMLSQFLIHSLQCLWPGLVLVFGGSLLNALPDVLYSRFFGMWRVSI